MVTNLLCFIAIMLDGVIQKEHVLMAAAMLESFAMKTRVSDKLHLKIR